MKTKNSKKKPSNRYLILSGVGLQMGVTIYLGAYLGKWLDGKFPSENNWYTIGLTLLAVGAAMFNMLRQVNRLNEESK